MKRNSKKPEIRRKELIDAAMRLFLEKGYEAVSVRAILDEVGGAPGMFYYYFKSKQEIYLATIAQYLTERIDRRCAILEDETVSFEEKKAVYHSLVTEDVAGYMESTIDGCSAEHTDVVTGMGGNSGAMGGGLAHSDVMNCSVDSCTVTAADGGMWIGGLSGCVNYGDAAASDHTFANCTVSNTAIVVDGMGGYVGGLIGAGGHTMTADDDARAVIDNGKVQNVSITVGDSVTCVGGLIGGGLRDGDVLPNSFCIKSCTVDDACRIVSAADSAANLIGTLIGEAYLAQIEKDGVPVDVIAREFDLSGTGTSTGIVLDGAEVIGGLTDK